ncbi:hypothetical protein ATK78_3365 [Pedobacter metabolipauper]|uniref:Uncharacterized protein n=1 Tax=Pedobacter metabolipauper TaxID=425513 RepID=A0A4R6SUY3_9SPHI|nr:hypothetical protein ATK78_3365 [Pedobacter metabolipauper]
MVALAEGIVEFICELLFQAGLDTGIDVITRKKKRAKRN